MAGLRILYYAYSIRIVYINATTFGLIVDPVNVNDTSSSYQCQVFVTNPVTNTKQPLQYYPQLTSGVWISIKVQVIMHIQ